MIYMPIFIPLKNTCTEEVAVGVFTYISLITIISFILALVTAVALSMFIDIDSDSIVIRIIFAGLLFSTVAFALFCLIGI